MKRPILIVVLGYITGIIIGLYCKISIAFLFLGIIPLYFMSKKYTEKNKNIKRYMHILIDKNIIVVFAIAAIISNSIVLYQNNSYENKYRQIKEANFIATVVSDKKEKEYYSQYKIKAEEIGNNGKYNNTYLLLNIKEDINLDYGDKISFQGEYKEPEIQRNYKGFSYSTYLKSIGIYGTVKANSVEKIGKGKVNFISKITNKLRKQIKNTVGNNIENEDRKNLLLGILLGYDDELSKEVKENFSNSGLSHILAVSGMHVSYILLGITYALKKMNCPKKITSIITILLLIFFISLTGEVSSVKRACIMTILSLGASILYRKSDITTNVSVSLLIILIQNPFSILDVGLILSFFATIGIIYMHPLLSREKSNKEESRLSKRKNNFDKVYKKIKDIVCISISAQTFILPISILLFNKITLTFLFSNLLISFLISSILVLGFISTLIPIKVFYFILNILLGIILQIANFFANLFISKIIVTTPHILLVIAYYIALIFFISIRKLRKKEVKRRIEKRLLTIVDKFKYEILRHWRKILCTILIFIILMQIIKLVFPQLTIHFIDVGQGDSCLVITPNNKTLLIDGGGNTDLENFDVGEQTLLPYILDRKIRKIDYLMISHFDLDHCNGLNAVLENIKVEKIIISKQYDFCEEYERIIEIIKRKNIKVIIVKAGDKINLGANVELQILYPEEKLRYSELNNNSIVAKLSYYNFSMLFTGDIEKEAEEELVQKYKEINCLKSTVLKVAHHGSKTSSTEKFLEAVSPKIALIRSWEK